MKIFTKNFSCLSFIGAEKITFPLLCFKQTDRQDSSIMIFKEKKFKHHFWFVFIIFLYIFLEHKIAKKTYSMSIFTIFFYCTTLIFVMI